MQTFVSQSWCALHRRLQSRLIFYFSLRGQPVLHIGLCTAPTSITRRAALARLCEKILLMYLERRKRGKACNLTQNQLDIYASARGSVFPLAL